MERVIAGLLEVANRHSALIGEVIGLQQVMSGNMDTLMENQRLLQVDIRALEASQQALQEELRAYIRGLGDGGSANA